MNTTLLLDNTRRHLTHPIGRHLRPRICLGLGMLAMAAYTMAEPPANRPAPPEPLIDQPEKFAAIVPAGATPELLAEGIKLGEGPVWVGGDDGYLLFSDVENNVIHKWSETGGLTDFRRPSNRTNGNALDPRGRLVSCEMSAPGRRVVRTEPDGSITVLADTYEGKKLNSPNDLAIQSDGTIWFSDPNYGIGPKMQELAGCWLFCLNPEAKELKAVVTDRTMPNGVVLSPDEQVLYLADSSKGRWIWAYDLNPDKTLSNPRQFAQIDNGISDGIDVDTAGNLYSGAPDGVHIFDPKGKRIGKIRIQPEHKGVNLTFGGPDRHTLFITARGGLYRITLLAQGLPIKPAP